MHINRKSGCTYGKETADVDLGLGESWEVVTGRKGSGLVEVEGVGGRKGTWSRPRPRVALHESCFVGEQCHGDRGLLLNGLVIPDVETSVKRKKRLFDFQVLKNYRGFSFPKLEKYIV